MRFTFRLPRAVYPVGNAREGRGRAMNRGTVGQQMDWRGVGLRGIVLLPLAVGTLLGVTQALILLCVLALVLIPL
jgi:hypothetical protein